MTRITVRRDLRVAVLATCFTLAALVAGAPRAQAGAPGCYTQPGDAAGMAVVIAAARAECDCAAAASHHAYIECLRGVADDAVKAGTIRKTCFKNVVRPLSTSTCGNPAAVTCCQIGPRGGQVCKIREQAANCKAPKGGSAYIGATAWCEDACTAP